MKASEMLLDLSGGKCLEGDLGPVSEPTMRRLLKAKLRWQLNGTSESPTRIDHCGAPEEILNCPQYFFQILFMALSPRD